MYYCRVTILYIANSLWHNDIIAYVGNW